MEEVTAYFHLGLQASVEPNPWREKGVPTALPLSPDQPRRVPYIFGVAAWPEGWGRVMAIRPVAGGIQIVSSEGEEIFHPVDLTFLR